MVSSSHHHQHQHPRCHQRFYLHWLQCDSAASGNIFSFLPFWLLFLSLFFAPPEPHPHPTPPPPSCPSISSLFWLRLHSRWHRERLLERQPVVEEELTANPTWEEEETGHHKKRPHANAEICNVDKWDSAGLDLCASVQICSICGTHGESLLEDVCVCECACVRACACVVCIYLSTKMHKCQHGKIHWPFSLLL